MKAARVIGKNELVVETLDKPKINEQQSILVKLKRLAYAVQIDIFYMELTH